MTFSFRASVSARGRWVDGCVPALMKMNRSALSFPRSIAESLSALASHILFHQGFAYPLDPFDQIVVVSFDLRPGPALHLPYCVRLLRASNCAL